MKAHLHDHLRWARDALVGKLDGLGEYDIRRPLTATGTNLLGLVKHCAIWDSRYFGEMFGRPFPEALPRWDDVTLAGTDHWATEHETREDIVGLYRSVWVHTDALNEPRARCQARGEGGEAVVGWIHRQNADDGSSSRHPSVCPRSSQRS